MGPAGHTAAGQSGTRGPKGHGVVFQTHTVLSVTRDIIVSGQGEGVCVCVCAEAVCRRMGAFSR